MSRDISCGVRHACVGLLVVCQRTCEFLVFEHSHISVQAWNMALSISLDFYWATVHRVRFG